MFDGGKFGGANSAFRADAYGNLRQNENEGGMSPQRSSASVRFQTRRSERLERYSHARIDAKRIAVELLSQTSIQGDSPQNPPQSQTADSTLTALLDG